MKIRIFFAAVAVFMGIATMSQAQNYGNRRNNHQGRNNQANYCAPNNGNYYNQGNYGYNRPYRQRGRRYVRANYCQPAPVVYQRAYIGPRPRVYVGRPRVNINIGF